MSHSLSVLFLGSMQMRLDQLSAQAVANGSSETQAKCEAVAALGLEIFDAATHAKAYIEALQREATEDLVLAAAEPKGRA